MKKRLLFSILGTVMISLILVTVLFTFIVDYEHEQSTADLLREKNRLIINMIQTNNVSDLNTFFKKNFIGTDIRVTYINPDGKVISDSEAAEETMENHNSRQEVEDARKNGTGSSIRYSQTINIKMMYVATSFSNGYIIRTAMPMKQVISFENKYVKYYILIFISVFVLSCMIGVRIAELLLKPIQELTIVTSQIALGDMSRRVKITKKDEIGVLATTFNEMADKLQETLKDALEKKFRLEAILESVESGIIAVDKNKKIIMINPYVKRLFGINKDILGKNFLDIIRNYELVNIFENTIDGEGIEVKILWPEERELKVKTADMINGEEFIGKVAAIQDLTDIKKLENMRSQFVANVSHELKTPLTSIKGFAETLKDVEDRATKEKFLNIINDEAERLTMLINDILLLSDLEQHKDTVFEVVKVKPVIEDVYNLIRNVAETKNISLTININSDSYILGNKDKLKQMMINLVDNAVKYSESGDSVKVALDEDASYCIISVEDTGPGIPKKDIERIFERFYRVDKARSRAKGGTGLGLAIVKHIVISFGGNVEVQSELGKGSKFIVKFPKKMQR